jgi:hypothetical protein
MGNCVLEKICVGAKIFANVDISGIFAHWGFRQHVFKMQKLIFASILLAIFSYSTANKLQFCYKYIYLHTVPIYI